jgi:hypothetical protein
MTQDEEITLIHQGAMALIAKEWHVETAVKMSAKALQLALESQQAKRDETEQLRSRATAVGGKSVCACGHLGDGPNSQHHGTKLGSVGKINNGHGKCCVEGCLCAQFTWAGWVVDPARAD